MADDPEETPLNRKAFFALEGASTDCVGDLIRLLRSPDPIHPIVRKRIAEALDGGTVGGAKLVLRDHGPINKQYRSVVSQRRKLDMGSEIQARLDEGMSNGDSIKRAVRDYHVSEELAEAGLTFYRKARKLADRLRDRPEYRNFDDDDLLSMGAAMIGKIRRASNPRQKRKPYGT